MTDDLTATIARVRADVESGGRCRSPVSREDVRTLLSALASATERAERAEAERDEWRAALQGLHREWARGDGHGGAKETADCIAGRRVTMSIDHGDEVRGLTAERDAALAKLARVETVAAALRNHPPEDMMGVTMLIGSLSDVLSDAPTDDAKPDSR